MGKELLSDTIYADKLLESAPPLAKGILGEGRAEQWDRV